jgi:hypothetical protein
MSAINTLRSMLDEPDPFSHARRELEPLWIEAINERISLHREQIPAVGRLVEESGVDSVSSLREVVPLLFAHSNYKSYSVANVTKLRWERMNRWLDALSADRVDTDVTDVGDQDDWLARLHADGHPVLATTGTSGKNSFLPGRPSDIDFSMRAIVPSLDWVYGIKAAQDRAVFVLSPKYGPTRASLYYRTMAEAYGRPDQRFFLTDEPMRLSELTEMANLRKAIADGTATPNEIAGHEEKAARRQAEMTNRLEELANAIVDHRDQPMIVSGFWSQHWMILEAAKRRGLRGGSFNPDIVVMAGGGTKGAQLPSDYKEQILELYGVGPERVLSGYGMSEVSTAMPLIDDRYRIAPWVVPLLLDHEATRLIDPVEDRMEGRFAFFDVSIDGRWGGVVTGDRVIGDFSTPTLTVVDGSVARYSDLEGGDDKLTCAGTVDAFVRGTMT